ncbi:predicted protein [Nematostella vectensis]|uniref:UMOD/GP2/OIT3-like D8C domain-containing protein n=1 Tax=Nematostella vectensis TaxID=45351 RepID=A7SZ70_NEMVE|nr:predicted protein [Nematostella vectensis]|eukprot:XP_001623098.1 predicted protein [Nematostella vectensis]
MVRRPALIRAALFFFLAFGAFQRCVGQALTCPEPTDPCVTHKSIKEPFRSSAHNYSHTQPAICDNRLTEGWYRFTSGVGGKIPTTKPEPNTCGTVAPIWMNSPHPHQVGQTVDATACINLNNIRWGCFRTIDICAKKCEDMATMANYFVYYLRPPFGCDMAYCAELHKIATIPSLKISPSPILPLKITILLLKVMAYLALMEVRVVPEVRHNHAQDGIHSYCTYID